MARTPRGDRERAMERVNDRRRNKESESRRFSNNYGSTMRRLRVRIPLKRERIAELEKELGYVS